MHIYYVALIHNGKKKKNCAVDKYYQMYCLIVQSVAILHRIPNQNNQEGGCNTG